MNNLFNSQELQNIISFISSPEIQEILFPVKIVFIFFAIAFLSGVVYFYFKSSYLKYQSWTDLSAFFKWKSYGLRKIIKRWESIQKRMESPAESEHKLAIIEVDDFLNEILEMRGYKGTKLEERISQVEDIKLSNIKEILDAHKIRNALVYQPDYKLEPDKAKKLLEIYEKAIKEIESF